MTFMTAPPPIVPALVVAFFAAGTAAGYVLVRRAILVRPYSAEHSARGGATAETDARLARIEASPPGHEQYRELGEAVRGYLDARFRVPARTAGADVERALTRAGQPRPLARSVAQLLERCDAAGAGAYQLDAARLRQEVASARELLRALDRA